MILNCLEKLRKLEINQKLQDDIDKLVRWFEKWQMLFNFGKCKCLHTGPGNIDMNYEMGGTILIFVFKIKEMKMTRGHSYTLVKKENRLDVRKYSFSQRTINVWNKLSTDCVHASSVNMFNNGIDREEWKRLSDEAVKMAG